MNWRGSTGQGPVSHPGMLDQGLRWRGPFRRDTGRAIQMPISRAPEDLVPKGEGSTMEKLKK